MFKYLGSFFSFHIKGFLHLFFYKTLKQLLLNCICYIFINLKYIILIGERAHFLKITP